MILKIDFHSETPIYVQIKNQVIEGIAKGEIELGEELPSVRSLAEDIGVNMHTVNKSYNILKEEGYIKIDRRKGAIVSLNLDISTEKFNNEFNENLYFYIAQCINRNISIEEVKKKIDNIYEEFINKENK
ncbi:GntR family transcriptional regulator [Caproiciproducens sp. MSJ-32]|uniref:GntR family transcriptional regulator n=1 Tax=Caproiciproducens sp. MSJ-32 TaxID=2841527 RepID=UPI001C11C931|nr:GntR family transcriptional regulator [Caproiciproducens sp. MSJ-32]MBU5455302.1 GntR family transcriptional regulator [Caproiciproducens sp. MSJ-32]